MAGLKFLNPILKIMICIAGMVIIGYYLYGSLSQGLHETITLVRALVFAGFSYLLVQSIGELIKDKNSK
jgi:TRAP-type mannitol/chloroaromatic compound transport system permease small subunit